MAEQTIDTDVGPITVEVSQIGWHVVEGIDKAVQLAGAERTAFCEECDRAVEETSTPLAAQRPVLWAYDVMPEMGS